MRTIQGSSPFWARELRNYETSWIAVDLGGARDIASNAASKSWLIGSIVSEKITGRNLELAIQTLIVRNSVS